MATFTVSTADKKSEKVLKAFFKALEVDYKIEKSDAVESETRPLNKKEKQLFESLKNTFQDIKKYEKGELQFKDAMTFVNEL